MEDKAAYQLRQQSVEVLNPVFLAKTKDRHIVRKRLFPSYLFFALDDPALWSLVQRTIGIHRVMVYVPHNQEYARPVELPSLAIDSLRKQLKELDEIRTLRSAPPMHTIKPGCYVRVKSGVFAGQNFAMRALVEWADRDRIGLVLELFNRRASVEFYYKDVELVEEPNNG